MQRTANRMLTAIYFCTAAPFRPNNQDNCPASQTLEIVGESTFGLWESEITDFCCRIREDRSSSRFGAFLSVQKYDKDLGLKFMIDMHFATIDRFNVPDNKQMSQIINLCKFLLETL